MIGPARSSRLPLVALLLAAALPAAARTGERFLTIAYTAELHGNLMPCSCPARPYGGLARRVGWIDSLRAGADGPLLVVDAGGAMPTPNDFPLLSPERQIDLLKLHALAVDKIAYDAMLGRPPALAGSRSPRWMVTGEARLLMRGGLRIIVAAADEAGDPASTVAAVRALGPADLVVLLCAGDLNFGAQAARRVGAQVAVVSRGACFSDPVRRDGVLLLGSGVDGKYVGVARIAIPAAGGISAVQVRLRPMDASVPVDPDWRTRVEAAVLSLQRDNPNALSRGE